MSINRQEYWIGLDQLAAMTGKERWNLEITVRNGKQWFQSNYDLFQVRVE